MLDSATRPTVTEIDIGTGITEIADKTGVLNFVDRSQTVKTYRFAGSVERIGKTAFYKNDQVENVYLAYGLKSIGNSAFYACKALKRIELPATLESIGDSAFEASGLETVTIPYTMGAVGKTAFARCNSLTSVTVEGGSFDKNVFFRCDYLAEADIDCEVLGERMFAQCKLLEKVTLGDSVKTVGAYAFETDLSLADVTIGENVTWIGSAAFKDCAALEGVTLPEGLTRMDGSVFEGCTALQSIAVPAGVTEGFPLWAAFRNCIALKSADIACPTVGKYCFEGCTALTDVTLREGVQKLEEDAFKGCTALTELSLPDTLTELYETTFWDCDSLAKLTLGAGFTDAHARTLQGAYGLHYVKELEVRPTSTTLKSVDGVVYSIDGKRLVWYPLYREGEEYTVPDGVEHILQSAFWWDSSSMKDVIPPLRVLHLPGSLVYCDSYFYDFDEFLTDIWFDGTEERFLTITYSDEASSKACGLVNAYTRAKQGDDTYDAEYHFTGADNPVDMKGDVNGDGVKNRQDRVYLARALAGWEGYTLPDAAVADVNGDGKVNRQDRVYLARALAGWDDYKL